MYWFNYWDCVTKLIYLTHLIAFFLYHSYLKYGSGSYSTYCTQIMYIPVDTRDPSSVLMFLTEWICSDSFVTSSTTRLYSNPPSTLKYCSMSLCSQFGLTILCCLASNKHMYTSCGYFVPLFCAHFSLFHPQVGSSWLEIKYVQGL